MKKSSPALPLYLGCPVWNCAHWADEVFPVGTPKRSWLHWYTRMFNSVEGNSSFYAMPTLEQVKRWADESCDGFHFCLKFPRLISHDLKLQNAGHPTDEFVDVLRVLADAKRLGSTFLQLGPDFSPAEFAILRDYLLRLPREIDWAVELRHPGWFDRSTNEAKVNELLTELSIDKVVFDSRALFASPAEDEIEKMSQGRKPRTPVRQTVTGKRPMIRLIGRNRIELVESVVKQWVPIVAGWIQQGLRPYVFTHAPDDQFAPKFARMFWEQLARNLAVDADLLPSLPRKPRQLELL